MQDYGLPKRSTLSQTPYQIAYPNWLCAQIELPPVEKWSYMMYKESILNIKEMRDGYKDQWNDAYWEGIIKEYKYMDMKKPPLNEHAIDSEGAAELETLFK
ncbi:hypothetical protein PanWU01x14_052370 [Parasponia andersonii]|uniref:Uncharacterized protein n=1 Tax=Parasponia andersonii TaxID=3476 RepID=A0A2P5DM96_PARAD|nr:hypothetical protein PanWU01x14_052370 [Parasponia andersonii]